MKYKLIIFDLDGTIVQTDEDLADALNATLKRFKMPLRTNQEVKAALGYGIRKLVSSFIDDESQLDEMMIYFKEYYYDHCVNKSVLYPNVLSMLKLLKQKGYILAMVSNKIDNATNKIINHLCPDIFDYCYGERANIAKKPDPISLIEIMNKTGVDKSECVYIGDSEVDIQTAINAGIDCISVSYGYRSKNSLLENKAALIVDSVKELEKILIN